MIYSRPHTPSYNIKFLSSKMWVVPHESAWVKTRAEPANYKDKISPVSKRAVLLISRTPLLILTMLVSRPQKTNYIPQFLPNQITWGPKSINQSLRFDHPQNFLLAKNWSTPPMLLKLLIMEVLLADIWKNNQILHVVFTILSKNLMDLLNKSSNKTYL